MGFEQRLAQDEWNGVARSFQAQQMQNVFAQDEVETARLDELCEKVKIALVVLN